MTGEITKLVGLDVPERGGKLVASIAAGTEALPVPDAQFIEDYFSRIAYVAPMKKAQGPALIAGTNVVPLSSFTGDSIDPNGEYLIDLKIFRDGAVIDGQWTYSEDTESFSIAGSIVHDIPLLVQYGIRPTFQLEQSLPTIIAENTDSTLREDLSTETDSTLGAFLVGRSTANVTSIAELRTIEGKYSGQTVNVIGYYSGSGKGGGIFRWNSTATFTDDGGVYIQATGIVTGRWVREIGPTGFYEYGAVGDGVTDDRARIQACLTGPYSTLCEVPMGVGTFGVGGPIVAGSNVTVVGVSPSKSILLALGGYTGGGTIFGYNVPGGAVTGVRSRDFRVDCNDQAAHGFGMTRAYDANIISNIMSINTADAFNSMRFVGLNDGGPVVIGQTLTAINLFAGHKNSTATAATIFLESLQESVFIECKAWGCYGSSKAPASPWVLQDCRSITLLQPSAATTSGYGIRVLAGSRDSVGICIIAPLYENVDNLLETLGTGFSIIGLSQSAPRFQSPIAATARYLIQQANSCRFEVLSSNVTIGGTSLGTLIETIDSTKVTNGSTTSTIIQQSNAVFPRMKIRTAGGLAVFNSDESIEMLRTQAPVSGSTGLLIAVNNGTTTVLKTVIVGSPDSGSVSGRRALEVIN